MQLDDNDRQTPGWKYNHWELRGVPVRVEVGPRDVEARTCVVARRDRPGVWGVGAGAGAGAGAVG